MNVLLTLDDFNIENIFFMDKIKNNILEDSLFTKIIYSNDIISLNGIYLHIKFLNYKVENYNNKTKYNLNNENNNIIINKLSNIEKSILTFYNKNINHQYNIHKQLNNGIYKCNIKDNKLYVKLKISGIWDNKNNCGLTFKFI